MNPLDLLKPVAYPSGYPELPFEVNYRHRAESCVSWTGGHLNGRGRTPSELIHEACHFWVAGEEQRKTPEFGLGLNAATNEAFRPYVKTCNFVSKKEAWRQEEEASVLQVIVMRNRGMVIEKTLDEHGWLDIVEVQHRGREALREFARSIKPVLLRLLKKRLIDRNFRPLV